MWANIAKVATLIHQHANSFTADRYHLIWTTLALRGRRFVPLEADPANSIARGHGRRYDCGCEQRDLWRSRVRRTLHALSGHRFLANLRSPRVDSCSVGVTEHQSPRQLGWKADIAHWPQYLLDHQTGRKIAADFMLTLLMKSCWVLASSGFYAALQPRGRE